MSLDGTDLATSMASIGMENLAIWDGFCSIAN